MKVNILGTEYTISKATPETDAKLENANGYIECYSKEIILDEIKPENMTVKNLDDFKKKVLRHEIIHAFLFESGLDACSNYARNEELVDWIALQFPKLLKAFQDTNSL